MAASDVSDVSVTLSGQGDPPSCLAPCNVDAVNVSNPWPYLASYRKHLGIKGTDNILVFQCLLCLPTVKKISANFKSQFNQSILVQFIPISARNTNIVLITLSEPRVDNETWESKHVLHQQLTKRRRQSSSNSANLLLVFKEVWRNEYMRKRLAC